MTQSVLRDFARLPGPSKCSTPEPEDLVSLDPADGAALLREYFLEADWPMKDAGNAPLRLWERALLEPLSEFITRPSKCFRGKLVQLAWKLSGNPSSPPPEVFWIVEALHAGSLIVDDIQDGSAYRRGGPALHCSEGVPLALNAGNWLYFWPTALLSRLSLPPFVELAVHRAIGRTLLACHQGQALDLAARVTKLEQEDVPPIVRTTTRLKTGRLFELAAVLGATAAGAGPGVVRPLSEFGEALGTGLQMLDDVGGILSPSRSHEGHEDLLNERPTWPWAWAAERLSRAEYTDLRALGAAVVARDRHPELLSIELRRLLGEAARASVSAHLRESLDRLRRALGASPAIDAIEKELARMEKSYG